MAQAVWNGQTLAQSDQYELVEGNVYFPASSMRQEFLRPSTHSSVCPWKGIASYYDVVVDGQVNANAAWYYAAPKQAAANIQGHVAFWKGVEVTR